MDVMSQNNQSSFSLCKQLFSSALTKLCRVRHYYPLSKAFLYKMKSVATKPTNIELKDCHDYQVICPHDSLQFDSPEEWKSHHLKDHMDTKWKCPFCGTQSSSWYNYTYHVQAAKHKSECPPPWICTLKSCGKHDALNGERCCGARFGSKYQLIRHIRTKHRNYKVKNTFFALCRFTTCIKIRGRSCSFVIEKLCCLM